MRVWINGKPGTTIAVSDRGFQYGDGLFETMRVRNSRIPLLELHLDRLGADCRRLLIPAPGRRILRAEIRHAAARVRAGVVKLILTRGGGERGYRIPDSVAPLRVMIGEPQTPARSALSRSPVQVRICRMRLGSNPQLAGMKTLNRLESVLARSEWRDARIAEGLMLDMEGHLVCGTMSNVFIRRGRRVSTPSLEHCGVAGVMRRWVLGSARQCGLECGEALIGVSDLASAEEVFLTNAVAGIVSVRALIRGRSRTRYEDFSAASKLRAIFEAL